MIQELAGTAIAGMTCAGLWCLAVAMSRHHRQVWGKGGASVRRRRFGFTGAALLAGVATTCWLVWGPGPGTVILFGLMTLAGFGVASALQSIPQRTPLLTVAALSTAVIALSLLLVRPVVAPHWDQAGMSDQSTASTNHVRNQQHGE